MYKTTPSQYAQALLNSVAKADEQKMEKIVENFVRLLFIRRERRKIPAILRAIEQNLTKEGKLLNIELTCHHSLSAQKNAELEKDLTLFGKKTNLTTKARPELLGGATVLVNDTLFDASLKTKIDSLFKKLIS